MVRVQCRVSIRISGRVKVVVGVRNIILNLSCLPLQTRLARQAFVVASAI